MIVRYTARFETEIAEARTREKAMQEVQEILQRYPWLDFKGLSEVVA